MNRTLSGWKVKAAILGATFATLLGASAGVRAEESNRNEVRANLERGGWRVVWGKNFTEGDWVRGTKAIAESIAAENPGPFLAWFEQTLEENFGKIERNLKGVTRRDLERWLVQSLREKKIITYRGLKIDAGFATYNRWQRVVYDEPRTRQVMVRDPITGIKTYVPEFYTERVEKQMPLPNWHQFYIRYQLTPSGGSSSGGSGAGGSTSSVVRIEYTIWNDSGRTVQFRLPSGQTHTLQPGQRGRYRNNGRPDALKIYVLNTGRVYTLTSGNHKFWWMSKERRIGFHRNYAR